MYNVGSIFRDAVFCVFLMHLLFSSQSPKASRQKSAPSTQKPAPSSEDKQQSVKPIKIQSPKAST